jgi:hypothetical protein
MSANVYSLYYGGPISYWRELALADDIVIGIQGPIQKKSYANRMTILSANGPLTLSIPLQGGRGQKSNYKEIAFSNNDWKHNHLYAFQSAYAKSPFYEYYMPKIEMVYLKDFVYLYQFNRALFETICSIVKWSTEVKWNDELTPTIVHNPSVLESIEYYPQVFRNKYAFVHDASIFDLIFNLGNRSMEYLKNTTLS